MVNLDTWRYLERKFGDLREVLAEQPGFDPAAAVTPSDMERFLLTLVASMAGQRDFDDAKEIFGSLVQELSWRLGLSRNEENSLSSVVWRELDRRRWPIEIMISWLKKKEEWSGKGES